MQHCLVGWWHHPLRKSCHYSRLPVMSLLTNAVCEMSVSLCDVCVCVRACACVFVCVCLPVQFVGLSDECLTV